MNPKPCVYSNTSEAARGETHRKSLLLSYKKFYVFYELACKLEILAKENAKIQNIAGKA